MGAISTPRETKYAFDSALPFDTSSIPVELIQGGDTVKKTGEIRDPDGMRGTRAHISERARTGPYTVGGVISMNPSPVVLNWILEYCLGTAESADTFALGETISPFQFMADRVAKVFTYTDLYVNSMTLKAPASGLLQLDLDVVGKTESVGAAGTYPALTQPTDPPYQIEDCDAAVSIGGTVYEIEDLEVKVDNVLGTKFRNSLTATRIKATDRIVTAKFTVPYTSDEVALYDAALAGLALIVTFSNGGYSFGFTAPAFQIPSNSPQVGSDEIPLVLEGVCRKSGSTAEIEFTNDNTA